MADSHTAPPAGDAVRPHPAPGSSGGAPQPLATASDGAKHRVGVFERPAQALGSWSPMMLFALVFGLLFLLWLLGIFDALLR